MAGELFDRAYKLTVTDLGFGGTTVQDLNVKFSIKKFGSQKANVAKFEVYNLSKATRDKFSTKNVDLIFECGYVNEFGLLFKGQIDLSNHVKSNTEWITTLECKDGLKQMQDTILSFTVKEGETYSSVLNKIISESGIDKGFITTTKPPNFDLFSKQDKAQFNKTKSAIQKDLSSHTYNKAASFHGAFETIMNTFTSRAGLKWSINDGKLDVYPPGIAKPIAVININKNSGMIGSPERLDRGLKVKSLLRPLFIPGVTIKLEADDTTLNGEYNIVNVEHTGELDSTGNWVSILEVIEKK